jgi:hypothetical protein
LVSQYLSELRRHERPYSRLMELHEMLDKLARDVAILKEMDRRGSDTGLMVDQAKRVRRTSTLVVRVLAEERDTATA